MSLWRRQLRCDVRRMGAQALHFRLTTAIHAKIVHDAGPELTAMLGNTIISWIRKEMTPIAAMQVLRLGHGELMVILGRDQSPRCRARRRWPTF